MSEKRLRIFAGPNGSGKTTIISELKAKFQPDFFGTYVNADDIESELAKSKKLNLTSFQITLSTEQVKAFFRTSTFSPVKTNNPDLWKNFSVENNHLIILPGLILNSYIAADIAELIRQTLLGSDRSFTYETVMSDVSKLEFIKKAKGKDYRVYLYYISTEDPDINISRVNFRVSEHGHAVDPEIIRKRFFKSLGNLKQAVLLTNRAYIFDNSGKASILIAEITEGSDVKVFDPEKTPNWFTKYLAN